MPSKFHLRIIENFNATYAEKAWEVPVNIFTYIKRKPKVSILAFIIEYINNSILSFFLNGYRYALLIYVIFIQDLVLKAFIIY